MSTPAPHANPHVPVRPEWLALAQEEVLDASRPVIDAHHHLWERDYYPYRLDRLLDDVASGHDVRASVFVECHAKYRTDGPPALAPVGETDFVLAEVRTHADRTPVGFRPCAGIVGRADLRLDNVRAALEAHLAASDGRFRGIRQISAWHGDAAIKGTAESPPPGLLADAGFRRGFAHLAAMGLSFDAWLYFTQLNELADLASAFPDTCIVLDHVGGVLGVGPYARDRGAAFDAWRAGILKAAERPNVHVKLSGLGMRTAGFDFPALETPPLSEALAATWWPYFETCIEAFGPARCMFASNFPVDKGAFSYRSLWNAHKRIASRYSAQEGAALLHDTAARVYRLDVGA